MRARKRMVILGGLSQGLRFAGGWGGWTTVRRCLTSVAARVCRSPMSLAERYSMTGVDVSREMIVRARENVPSGEFVCDDVMSLEFEACSFDAVVAFYSIFHLPREEHRALFRRIHDWLKPGGYLLCTLSHRNEDSYTEEDFFGVRMFWSNYGLSEYLVMLAGSGFEVVEVSSTSSGYEDTFKGVIEDHPLVLARSSRCTRARE